MSIEDRIVKKFAELANPNSNRHPSNASSHKLNQSDTAIDPSLVDQVFVHSKHLNSEVRTLLDYYYYYYYLCRPFR